MRPLNPKFLNEINTGRPLIYSTNMLVFAGRVIPESGEITVTTPDGRRYNFPPQGLSEVAPLGRDALYVTGITPERFKKILETAAATGYDTSAYPESARMPIEFWVSGNRISGSSPPDLRHYWHLDLNIPLHLDALLYIISPIKIRSLEDFLPEDVVDLITHSPTMPQLPGIIRSFTNLAVPNEAMSGGTDGITSWLMENVKTVPRSFLNCRPTGRVTTPPVVPENAGPVRAGGLMPTTEVVYDFSERETGACLYSFELRYRGAIDVPNDVIDRGRDAIVAWIRDKCYDDGNYDDRDYDYSGYEASETSAPQVRNLEYDEGEEDDDDDEDGNDG